MMTSGPLLREVLPRPARATPRVAQSQAAALLSAKVQVLLLEVQQADGSVDHLFIGWLKLPA